MKLYCIFSLALTLSGGHLFSQTNDSELIKALFPSMPAELKRNVVVLVGLRNSPQPCPPAFTNLLSNTNLLSSADQKLIKEVVLKYKNVTTNSGPSGSKLMGRVMRQYSFLGETNTFPVARFAYTNSLDLEEIASLFDNKEIIARFRTPAGGGYDILAMNGMLMQYQEYKNGVLDGLYIYLNNPNQPNTDYDKCYFYIRFENGKAANKYITWDEDGKIAFELEFKRPLDILKYSRQKMDLSWTEMPTSTTSPIQSPK
jgi:hypothetical protein